MAEHPKLALWWSRVDTSSTDGCWPWTRAQNAKGYGRFWADGRTNLAHRWGYQQLVAPLRPDEQVRHICDNPACCRPSHWQSGSNADNARDKIERGRMVVSRGEQHGRAKLTQTEVIEIRGRYTNGDVSQTSLAAEYGVSQRLISGIVTGQGWRHINF